MIPLLAAKVSDHGLGVLDVDAFGLHAAAAVVAVAGAVDLVDVEEEAIGLARLFGLPGMPHTPVSRARREDLNRAAFIRAFLGQPALIILERPTRDLLPGILPPLINAVRLARDKGSAIIWTTSEDLVWSNPDIHATLKCTMFGSRMNVVEEVK